MVSRELSRSIHAARTDAGHADLVEERIVIVSPHFDDSVLSCWKLLASDADVSVVNVFAGAPPPGTVGWWDRLSGIDSDEAARIRADEDERALARAGRRALNLDFLDIQYRTTARDPGAIADALREAIPAGATVYAPAAFALHDDHLDVRTAALALGERNPLRLYADLPHASAAGWPSWVDPGATDGDRVDALWARAIETAGVKPAGREAHALDGELLAAKLDAVREYRSQLPMLETSFGRVLDPGGPLAHEVEWRLPDR